MGRIKNTVSKLKNSPTPSFEVSKELKALFNSEFESWKMQYLEATNNFPPKMSAQNVRPKCPPKMPLIMPQRRLPEMFFLGLSLELRQRSRREWKQTENRDEILYVGSHPRIEDPVLASFLTTRSRNSELWFVNNPELEQAMLGYLAKFKTIRQVRLYAFAIEGSHTQGVAKFPLMNRADFMRDLNSSIARAVPKYTEEYPGGRFWGRRYSQEFIPDHVDDIEARFWYTVLQPVQDGLVSKISDYPGYNCFHDAVYGIERKFKVIDWGKYNAAKKKNPRTPIKKYETIVTLKYDRLPGYEHLSTKEYAELMMKKLEENRLKVIKAREARGLFKFLGRDTLLKVKRGSRPKRTKTSTINSNRPRVLSICMERWKYYMKWYFDKYSAYKFASKLYRSGKLNCRFPEGMYPPYLRCITVSTP